MVSDQQDGTLLLAGGGNDMGYLERVDTGSWRALWKVDHHGWVVAGAPRVLLCARDTRTPVKNGRYTASDQCWVALSKQDGTVLWSCKSSAAGAAVGDYFLVFLKDTIDCRNQMDGTVVKSLKINMEPYLPVSLVAKGDRLLVDIFRVRANHVHFSLSVPALERDALSQVDWDSATRTPPVQDGEYSYESVTSADWQSTSVVRTEIRTGKRQVLYEEPLPPELRQRPTRPAAGI
jgi:hypothetical protein